MKAFVYEGQGSATLKERPEPVIKEDTDAIVKVTMSSICMSDVHIIHGAVPQALPNTTLGHEFVGEVVETGGNVKKIRTGDRISANCITFCGDCWYCRQGYINNCIKGGWELGCRIDGCQAEYVRVPFADMGLNRIPDYVKDENALFTGDILSSGYFGAELCNIKPGDTILVIGAGPVGLCAGLCARLFGASRIVMADTDQERLALAKRQNIADTIINPRLKDAENQLLAINGGRGADGVIEAAGTGETFQMAWRLARPNSTVALVAMYEENQVLPLPQMYGKNLIFKTGGVDAVHCEKLLKMIALGSISTDFLITHRLPLADIEEGYLIFSGKLEHCMKVAIY